MAGAAKKASETAAAAAAEAALAAEALERETAEAAAVALALKAQQEAEEAAAKLKKQQEQDELDVVAVGAVAHVIRRAFHTFYKAPEDEKVVAIDCNEDATIQTEEGGDTEANQQVEEVKEIEQITSPREPVEVEESPFVAVAQARKETIEKTLDEKHQRARALLKFMETRQNEAAEADTRVAEELSQRGLIIKAQIPVGPTHLKLDDYELRAAADAGANFGELANSLLHAKTLVAEYEHKRNDLSGNSMKIMPPSRRTAAGEGSSENGEHIGYLDTTLTTNIRKEATLKHYKNHIAEVKTAHAEHRATTSNMHENGTTASDSNTTRMNPVEKRKNMVILERMQTKLDFVRNPRYAVPDQSNSQTEDDLADSIDKKTIAKMRFDIVPKPPILFTNYDIGGIYEQVVYVRNTDTLSRRVRILPPATIFFSMARVTFPEESGMVAPGMHVELRVRFAPDSRAEYKDCFIVQFETEQSEAGTPGAAGSAEMVVSLMARREPPELTLPQVVRAQNTLVGGCSVTQLVCKNLGGKARFWLLSEPAWSRLEHLQIISDGVSPTRSAVEMLGSEYILDATMDVGPFRITPNDTELDKGQSVTFNLVYTPSGVGEQRERFVMVCDNCLVRVFQIVGRGCQVDIAATSVNNSPIDTTLAEMGSLDRVFFPNEVLVNACAKQTIEITNDTPLDIKYCWKIQPLIKESQTEGVGKNKDKATGLSLSSGWTSPPYRISPESGVLSLSSSKEFVIEFLPLEARIYVCQATLMINDIPACSMPGPSQMENLKIAFQTREELPISPRAAVKAAAKKLRDEMPGISMQLHGRGRLGNFTITPHLTDSWIPLEDDGIQCPGNTGCKSVQLLQHKKKYLAVAVLKNQCDARVAFHWDLARLRQRHLSASGDPSTSTLTKDKPLNFDLVLRPEMGELQPLGQQRIELTFTPMSTGKFSLSVPCQIVTPNHTNESHAQRFERWLLLEANVAGAEIEIISPEVDFGLVLVGASAESFITIRNPSQIVTAHWKLTHLDGPTTDGAPGTNLQDAIQSLFSPKLRRSSSKESVISRHSVISASSGHETERSSIFTSRDIPPRATVAFAPENGELAPGETFIVKANCMAGSLPERFRGLFRCQVAPERQSFASNNSTAHAVVSARAEIQCPNVFLSTTKLPLGTTYMGVEIHRTIELVNVSNLETAFKFVEPEGVSRSYSITFSPKQGTIHSKERLVVMLNYTPRQVGRFTAILACSVRGLPAPLGFEVSSNHKGLVLSYELVQTPQPMNISSRKEERQIDISNLVLPKSPKEIALERGIPLADCELEPETNPLSNVPKVAFGDNIPLGERRALYLLIRNFSGIEALVDLEAKKFPVAVSSLQLTTSTRSLSEQNNSQFLSPSPPSSPSNNKHTNKLTVSKGTEYPSSKKQTSFRASVLEQDKLSKSRLSDAQDNGNRFKSDNGRVYLRQRAENIEDKQILRDGRGVAFQLFPARVHIPPWEQAVVRITCFNNMPGTYVDDIVSRATGAPPVFLHTNVGVVGTPLALDRNCVGLYFGKPVPEGSSSVLLKQPILNFGTTCVRAPAITKTLRVVNRGPQRARLKWKLVENGREDQLVNVTLRVDFRSRLELRITPCDEHDNEAALPFVVEPQVAMVSPFSTTPFHVTFYPSNDSVGAPRVLLLGDAHWYDASVEEKHSSDGNSTISIDSRHEVTPDSTGHNNNSPSHTVAAGKAFAAVRLVNAISRKPGPVIGSTPPSSFSPKCLRVLLSADVIQPELSIDMTREHIQQVQPSPPLSARDGVRKIITPPPQLAPYHIGFTTWSTLMYKSAAQHLFHRRELYLVNRMGSRMTFRFECNGPFAVAHADSLAPRHPLSMADLPQAHRRSTAQGESYMFMLPPQMSVRIDLRFLPSTSLITDSNTPASSKHKTKPILQQQQQPLHSQLNGELRVKFATKTVQTIRLAAVVLRPAIVVSPSVYFFGRVHLSASRFIILRVANPTVVPARFSVQHVPRPKPISRAQTQEMNQHHAHFTDEPGVFTFSEPSGELCGPTTSIRTAGGYLPTTDSIRDLLGEHATTTHPLVHAELEIRVEFHPRESGRRYKSRFRFDVEHGRDFEVVLEGIGHLDENDNPRDGDRPLVRVRELEHSYHIFRGTSESKSLHNKSM